MNATPTLNQKKGNQLWGIYYTDREYACHQGDPLRTVIEAPTKVAAERAAGKLGFESPRAHPVTAAQARQALWLPLRRTRRPQTVARKPLRGIRI